MNIKTKLQRHRWLVLVLLLAALVRIPVALWMGDRVEVLPGIHDQVSYEALAHRLLAGAGYSFAENWYPFTPAHTPTAHWSFLYPLYLAGLYGVVGPHPIVARLVQTVLGGAVLCLMVYCIGRRVANERAALWASALAAVYIYFIYYNAALMTETFFMVSVLLSLWLSLQLRDRPTLSRWVLLGCTLGVAILLRQTMLFFVPIILLYLFIELYMVADPRRRVPLWHFALPAIIVALFIMPWTIRNYAVYEHLLPLNSNAGYALYASNHPSLGTTWDNDKAVVPVPPELQGMNEAQLNSELTQRAIEFVTSDLRRYALLTLNKSLEYFKFWPSPESSGISNVARVFSFGVCLPLMLMGLILSFGRWRQFLPLYLFMFMHTGIYLLSWPAPRYRLPVDAVLLICAGMAIVALQDWLSVRWVIRPIARSAAREIS